MGGQPQQADIAALAREQLGFSRWWQVAAATVMMGLVSPYQYVWSSIQSPLASSLDVSPEAIGLVFTLFVIFQSGSQFPVGWYRDRHGPRRLTLLAGILAGGGYLGLSVATEVWQLYLLYSLGAVGVGIVYTVAVNTALKWFPDRRGLTTGLGTMAFAGGSALVVPYVRANATAAGYPDVLQNMGLAIGVGILLGAVVLRDPPGDWLEDTAYEIDPDDTTSEDGSDDTTTDERATDERATDERATDERATDERASDERASDERASDERASDERASDERASDERATDERASDESETGGGTDEKQGAGTEPGSATASSQYTWREMIRTWQFWLMYAMFVGVSAAGLMLTAQIVAFADALGLDAVTATASATVLPLAGGVGRLVVGDLSDRVQRERAMAVSFVLCGLGVLGTVVFAQMGASLLFVGAVIVATFFWSPQYTLFPSVVGDYYGREHSSANYALLYSGKMWGGVFGGAVVGWAVGASSWPITFLLGGVLAIGAGVGALVLREPA